MNNSVDIEVNLTGAEQARKGITGIGETAANMADRFDKTNSHLGEGLGSLVGNVDEARGAFKDLGSSIGAMGKGGKISFMGLLGPIGAVVAAGYGLYETFINISGAAQKAEEAQEAFGAAAADLQSKLEALAEKGVIPTAEAMKRFTQLNIKAQLSKEAVEVATKKVSAAMAAEKEAQEHLIDVTRRQGKAVSNLLTPLGVYDTRQDAREKRDKARLKREHAVNELARQNIKSQKELAAAEKEYLKLEELAPERLQTRIKENAARLKSLEIAEAESKYQADILDMQKVDIEQEEHRINLQAERVKGDADALQAILKDVDARVKRRNAEEIAEKRFEAQRRAIEQKRRDDQKKTAADNQRRADARRAREKLKAKQHQNELFQIRSLEIAQMQQNGVKAREIIKARYQLELDQAGKNANLRKMAMIRNEMAITQLTISEREKREADEKQRRDRQLNFMLETQAFNINKNAIMRRQDQTTYTEEILLRSVGLENMKSSLDQELAMLDLKYKKERLLKEHSESEITELTRRANIERAEIESKYATQQIEQIVDITQAIGGGFAEAGYASLVAGDSFLEGSSKIIEALGKQAAINALLETARGFAALIFDPRAAVGHFVAATAYGAAAAAAGTFAANMGGGGAASGGGGANQSPTGAEQVASTPIREQAENTSTVFNINFGGAVIYDSRQAAEMAFADRLTEIQNMRRRGAPRRSRNAV